MGKGGFKELKVWQRSKALAVYIYEWPIDLADPIIYHEPHGKYRGEAKLWEYELADFPRGISK